ncbi:protein of unknown function [Sulfitobacter marinus]|uniref:DUF4760 domain-containing protein n=1 Tax=Sulfitobacter marinus TaxID=394264 RepID=A0A1I6Q3G7_9RHOB|nr:protein of unknown function [Sulfitobacter marinus]
MIARAFLFIFGALLVLCTLCIFLLILLPLASASLSSVYALFPNKPSPQYTAFLTATGTIVAAISVVAAILTFWFSTRAARHAQRKQHTITVLLETRLSSEFQGTIEKRRAYFPEYTDVAFDDWNAARNTMTPPGASMDVIAEHKVRRDSALALTTLLNYYEFLAVGITEGDLDEEMLKKTLRSIMCNLVDDSRHLIAGMQKINPNTYEHLTALYGQWRKQNARDINGSPNERPIPRLR